MKFRDALEVLFENEGGYSDNSLDSGGKTKYGISDNRDGVEDGMIDLDMDGVPDVNVSELTIEQATEIYKKEYWDKLRLDEIKNERLQLHVFDMAVNSGQKQAIKILQKILGVNQDGIIGGVTLSVLNNYVDQDGLCKRYAEERAKFYINIVRKSPEKIIFLYSWIKRIL